MLMEVAGPGLEQLVMAAGLGCHRMVISFM